MLTWPGKKMLYVSIQDRNSLRPWLKFELEDYYERDRRRIHTERSLETFDADVLMADEAYVEHLGVGLVYGLLVRDDYKEGEPSWTQIVYPHERAGRPVLRIDGESYEYKPHRIFCDSMLLPTLNMSEGADNEELKSRIARTVLRYLPLAAAA